MNILEDWLSTGFQKLCVKYNKTIFYVEEIDER